VPEKILVTGATGFVMSGVARHLASLGHSVVAADLMQPDDAMRRYLSNLPGSVEIRQVDTTDLDSLLSLVREVKPTRAVAGAAITAIPPQVEANRFLDTVRVNVLGTLQTLEALRQVGCGRIVEVSSGSVYGGRPNAEPIGEESDKGPRALYPLTKWSGEILARRFGEVFELDLGIVRLCSPFGPFERDTGSRPLLSPISQWCRRAVRGEPIEVDGGPEMLRDVAYVEDVASGISAVLLTERLPHVAYNVGWGRSASSGEVLETLSRVVPGLRYSFQPERPSPWVSVSNAPRGPLSNRRLVEDLGWQPRYDLESGLAAYVEWLQSTEPRASARG
jgi:nucleoside-diphosphate-sugar epimerase